MRWWLLVVAIAACTGVQPRFPADLQTTLAHDSMRKLETERFIIYYSAPRRAEVDRFVARATRCADTLRDRAFIHGESWAEKMVIVMPDVAFNNAFVLPDLAGYEGVSVIPLQATLDFATEFGIPPDPGYIACHELVHYVHFKQIGGMWANVDSAFGPIYTPQIGYDPWFDEGLATHYESELQPGVGRPHWPIFTGMFAAAYAGQHVGGGDLSSLARLAPVGHHYLVGAMFLRFLTETYGDKPLWAAIARNAGALTGWFFAGTFDAGFNVSFSKLLDQFDGWTHHTFPVRRPPAAQRRLAVLGNDARYARGRDGTEAWIGLDVDVPPRLHVRDAHGRELADLSLVEIVPPRKLVQVDPLLVSGMSVTDSGDVWFTMIDQGATFQIPRTMRWTRAHGLEQIADDLGPGGAIDPAGRVYYYCWVDGDAWSLAAFDVATHARHMIVEARPGTYVLGAQVSPDGARVVASVWDGHAFVAWVIDPATGAIARTIGGDPNSPVYDPSFTSDGRVMWLGTIAGRFQAIVEGIAATDAPYAVLAAREVGGTIRFMDREGWEWELAETATPAGPRASDLGPQVPDPSPRPEARGPRPLSDQAYSGFDHLFFPQQRAPTLLVPPDGSVLFGLVLAGGDRLGLQRWSVAGYIQPALGDVPRTHYGLDVAYLNTMLAPVLLIGEVSYADWSNTYQDTTDPMNPVTIDNERRTRDASLLAQYTYRGTLTPQLGGIYTDDYDSLAVQPRRHVAGPTARLQWESAETTRYTDERRAIIASASAAYYPQQLSTFASDITDVGGELGGIAPLPFGRRHTLRAFVRGRALLAPFETGLLQLGGDSGMGELWANRDTFPTFDRTRFPPNLRFVEPLRGYEDYAITTDRAETIDVAWRYPVIIDRGVAATAYVLPTSFVRQVDFELFGTGALDKAGDRHVAIGSSIALRIQVLRIPLIITYQLARRLVDDRAVTQLVGVAPGP